MIAVLGAMQSELEEFHSCLRGAETDVWAGGFVVRGTIDGTELVLVQSGIGKVQAAMCTQYLAERFHPRAMIFTGLAGSLKPHISIGDTVIARDLVQFDMDGRGLGFLRGEIPHTKLRYISTDTRLFNLSADYQPESGRVHFGRICTGDQFLQQRDSESHDYLNDELDGDAVEMEGAAMALVCHLNKIPFLVARTISDMADGSAHTDFAHFLPTASKNSLKLVRHLICRMRSGFV